jgi:hypothetical protein
MVGLYILVKSAKIDEESAISLRTHMDPYIQSRNGSRVLVSVTKSLIVSRILGKPNERCEPLEKIGSGLPTVEMALGCVYQQQRCSQSVGVRTRLCHCRAKTSNWESENPRNVKSGQNRARIECPTQFVSIIVSLPLSSHFVSEASFSRPLSPSTHRRFGTC